jgi:hypothetical protein
MMKGAIRKRVKKVMNQFKQVVESQP